MRMNRKSRLPSAAHILIAAVLATLLLRIWGNQWPWLAIVPIIYLAVVMLFSEFQRFRGYPVPVSTNHLIVVDDECFIVSASGRVQDAVEPTSMTTPPQPASYGPAANERSAVFA